MNELASKETSVAGGSRGIAKLEAPNASEVESQGGRRRSRRHRGKAMH